MKKLLVVVFAGLMAGCAPSDSQIAAAIQLTNEAAPSETAIPPTAPPTITHTPEPTATIEPTATPDVRVVDIDPRQLLLERTDLPTEGKYYLPNSYWMTPHRNSEVVSGWGVEEGREYLATTGRIDGWLVAYARGTTTVNSPEEVYDNVVIYRSAAGAALVLAGYSYCKDPDNAATIVDDDVLIGDNTVICRIQEMQPSGRNRVWYRIEFIRRNVFHAVYGWGWETEVTPEFVQAVAMTLLEKVEEAPLSDEVTFRP